ncbi:methyl-accepting chemotaxis protein [Halogeometricum borinquense DSM 11551]|uniref:Methyl-accepting chemotaxis protein n=1 Tax=Halogeometricum borinquense (strain ATCC 700274 / DSM 11551 / JCM 10706 / KCTC 4070 / PR3) TaxID=469382 RepID=E4NWJ5_HALBP|nr:extracellular solute-binding protein [Halogeometricum borinquense]ADQ69415.1 methyl-accepting chemotaxis protein [Halogeometricum borinquense DSM 11551]ELY25967.1 methyl-accepting chemotaxis protein [Halogeometricum borinquense DSM 11551]
MRDNHGTSAPEPSLRERLAARVFKRDTGESSAQETERVGTDGGSVVSPDATTDATTDDSSPKAALAEEFTAAVNQFTDGDLSVRVDVPDDPEMAQLAESLNDLFAELHGTMADVDVFAKQVSASTESVVDSVEDSRSASRNVSDSVDDIAEGATQQSESIDEVANEMRNLSATVEEVASSADEIASSTSDAATRGQQARDAAEEAIDGLDAIDEQTQRTVSQVDSLNELIDDITGVVTQISEIAEQTNILALNASIEAARANEAGAGFAVVADEVKSLATETQEATEDIEAAIEEIRAQSEETVEGITEARERVATESETIEEALGSLDEMVEDVQETNASVQEISDATDSQATTAQEVVGQADEVGAISEETAAQATTVVKSARRQTTSLSEAMTNVNALAEQADVLQETLDEYDLGKAETVAGKTIVQFWHAMSGSKAILMESFAEEFNDEHDDIHVHMSPKGNYRGTFDATMAAARSGSPPTVAQLFEIGTKRALDSGVFTPVESVLPAETSTSDLVPSIANYYRDDGTLWSLPFNSSNPVLYYNADAFERAGLDPSNPPETFDDLTQAAEKVVESGAAEYGATWANYSWFIEQWFATAGETLVDASNGRDGTATTANLSSDTGETIFRWWSDLARTGLLFDPGIEARGRAREAFLDGDAAMLVDSSSNTLSVVEGADERGFNASVGKFPAPGTQEGVVVGGASLWVADDVPAREQEAAGRFLAWLTEPEQQRRWHQQTGYFPVHGDAERMLRRDGWFEEHPEFAVAFEQLNESQDTPATCGARIGPFSTVRTIISEGLSELIEGREVERVLEEMNEQVEYRLSEYDE